MELTLAALADAANRSDTGKLNLLGVFHTIYAPAVPCQHPMMSLVLSFEATPLERGTQAHVGIVLIDEDGQAIISLPHSVLDVPADASILAPSLNLIVNFGGVTFEKYGMYRFEVTVDGASLGRVPLHIQRPERS